MNGKFFVFKNLAGLPAVAVRFEDDNVWLTQQNLADLYHTSKSNIVQHLKNIFESRDLQEAATVKKFLTHAEKFGKLVGLVVYYYNLAKVA